MKIGFIVKYKSTLVRPDTGVWGEEMVALDYVSSLKSIGYDCDVYVLSEIEKPLDIAIHMNDLYDKNVLKNIAKTNILWIQGFTYGNDGIILPLEVIYQDIKTKYDKVFSASRKLCDKYDLPFIIPAVNMRRYHSIKNGSYDYDVSFIGNIIKNFETNQKYLKPMAEFKYGLFGGDFGKISHDEWIRIVNKSKINLHFGFPESIEWDMVTGRPFFIAACNAFCLCDTVPFFTSHYADAFGFSDGGDTSVDIIRYYIDHEEERKEMADLAYEITKENFSSDVLCKDIIKAIGG